MSLKIGIVTPFTWDVPCGVNRQVAGLAARLCALGHRPTIIAPSRDAAALAASRARVRSVLLDERPAVFAPEEPFPRQFFAGGTYRVRHNRSLRLIAAPVDLIANIDVLLESEDLDVLHLHEPFVPSRGWTALRHAGCPLVATFYANSEQLRQYWRGRPRFRRLFDALDAVVATSRAAADAAAGAFPGAYHVIPPGIDTARFAAPEREVHRGLRLLFVGSPPRRKGLGTLLRALRLLDDVASRLSLEVCGAGSDAPRLRRLVPPAFEGRVVFHGAVPNHDMPAMYAHADVVCAPSLGPESVGMVLLEAMASGTAVIASRIPGHDEVLAAGRDALLVRPRDVRGLATAIRTLAGDDERRASLAAAGRETVRRYDWDRVADDLCAVYEEVAGRRRRPLPRRRRQQREVFADLHVHSHHSKDCVMPVADILERARRVGLDVVAITDHDSVAGGLEARELSERYGVRVIVGEEVKTSQGEVIGLFMQRTVPPGMNLAETIAAIREQDGVVYVPHPFDRLHTVPSPALLREHVGDIDVVEVFNSRLAFPAFNDQAESFARRYRIPAAAGSDSHVLPGIGTALTGMDDFEGRHDFVAALAESRIVRRPRSVLYLQSLKFIQTSLEGSGRAVRDDGEQGHPPA